MSNSSDFLRKEKREAQLTVRIWDKRAIIVGAVFILNCAAVYPFLAGHALHNNWDTIGKHLLLVALFLFVPFVICTGIAINSRFHRRSLRKTDMGNV